MLMEIVNLALPLAPGLPSPNAPIPPSPPSSATIEGTSLLPQAYLGFDVPLSFEAFLSVRAALCCSMCIRGGRLEEFLLTYAPL